MDHVSGFSVFSLFLMFLHLSFCFTGGFQVVITAAEGQDRVLPCSGREGLQVSVLEWTRLNQDRDLLLVYRAGKVLHGYEHKDYTDRVQLLHPQLTRGDLSVVLKNVTLEDRGTYKCHAFYKDGQETSQIIILRIKRRGSLKSVSAAEGQDCVLPCSGVVGSKVVLFWTRLDLHREMLMFREGKVLNRYEDSVYTNRVQLLDPQLTRGDLSVVLKELTLEDSGIYHCYALYDNDQMIFQSIHLKVTERDTTPLGLSLGLSTGLGLILVIAVLCFINRRRLTRLWKRLTNPNSAI